MNELQKLRDDIISQLRDMSDKLTDDDSANFELLMILARNSNDTKLLSKAVEKAKSLKDEQERVDALLDVLEEVNIQLGDVTVSEEESANEPKADNPEPAAEPAPEETATEESAVKEEPKKITVENT